MNRINFIGTAVTDVGTVKKVNQDSVLIKIVDSSVGEICMAVVCDGVGGLSQGEVASANVIMAFDTWFKEEFLNSDNAWNEEKIKDAWENIVFSMNARILRYGKEKQCQLGTTLTVSLFVENRYYIMHIGDCRLYEIKDNCSQITKDQTLIANELELGIITEEEAANDSRKNVLLQCIGVTEKLEPSFISGYTSSDTCYLLCTDGFRHLVSNNEIYEYCRPDKNANSEMLHSNLLHLVQINKQRGENDNISAVLIYAKNGN